MVPPNVTLEMPKKREQAKVSPYVMNVPKQEISSYVPSNSTIGYDRSRGGRSPKVEVKLPPLEVEISNAALQGKLAYVSPQCAMSMVKLISNQPLEWLLSTQTLLSNSIRPGK